MLRNIAAIALLSLALIPGCTGAMAQINGSMPSPASPPSTRSATSTAPTPSRPVFAKTGAVTIAAVGRFQVGQQDFVLGDAGNALHVTALYPVEGDAPDRAHGPYPLVVFSPGLGSSGEPYRRLLDPIASHGFVVLVWTPRGETGSAFWAGAATRPLDLQRTIDFADSLDAAHGALTGLIDTRKIAVVGHSSGGWSALMGGGARMDLGWCAHPDPAAHPADGNCPQFVAHQAAIAAMLGLAATPTGMWPPMHDPRVAAVIAMSPDGDLWGADYAGVASVKVPTMVMAGGDDNTNIPKYCAFPIYQNLGSVDKTLVVFANGNHDLGWDTYSEQIKQLMAAFLLAHLKGDADAADALLPANIDCPGITYTTGAGNHD